MYIALHRLAECSVCVAKRRDLVATMGMGILSLGNMNAVMVRCESAWNTLDPPGPRTGPLPQNDLRPPQAQAYGWQVRLFVILGGAGWGGGARAPEKNTGISVQDGAIYKSWVSRGKSGFQWFPFEGAFDYPAPNTWDGVWTVVLLEELPHTRRGNLTW